MDAHIDFGFEKNYKNLDFKVGEHSRISNYKNNFVKDTHQIDLKKFWWLKILRKLYRRRIDQGSEFYYRPIKL